MDIFVLFLVALAVVFGGAMLLAYRTRGWAPGWSAHAESDLEVPVGRAEALARSLAAVSSLRLLGVPEIDEAKGTVEAKVLGLWRTFADLVTLEITEIDPGRTLVRIRSRPVLPQWNDYGASRARVDDLGQRISVAAAGPADSGGLRTAE